MALSTTLQGFGLLGSNASVAGAQSSNLLGEGSGIRDQGLGFLSRMGSTLAAPKNFFQSLISGAPGAATAAVAPDVARMQSQQRSLLDSTSTLSPRGAGRAGTLFGLPFQTQAGTAALYNSLQPAAANALTSIAGQEGTAGSNLVSSGVGLSNTGANLLNTSVSSAHDLTAASLEQQKQDMERSKMLGSFLGSILGPLISPITSGAGKAATSLFGL